MLIPAGTTRIGLLLSLTACAVAICVQAKYSLHRPSEQVGDQEFFSALGGEAAWPYLRQDLSR